MLLQILQNIRTLRQAQKKVLVVFDLDSTIFDVSPRTQKILWDFADVPVHQALFPKETQNLKRVRTQRSDWGVDAGLERAGLHLASQEFREALLNYWKRNFFSNHYLQFDNLYEGAAEFLNEVHQISSHMSYLTGRDVERMGNGSREVINLWGLPLDEKAELVLKPHKSLDDAQFKTDYFIEQAPQYDLVYFFENEPVNLIHLQEHCPQVQMIFFESTHSGKAHPPANIHRINSFKTGT